MILLYIKHPGWLLGISLLALGSMGESCVNAKVDHSISIEKCIWALKGMGIHDFNNIKHDSSYDIIPFKMILID